MCALSPSLTTPPQFLPNRPGVPSLAPVAEERRGPNDLLGAPQLRRIEAELLHKVSFGGNGVTKDEFIQILREQFGDRRFVAELDEFITRHGCTQKMSFCVFICKCSFWLGLGHGMWTRHVSLGAEYWASICEQTCSLFECFAELLEFACVESEGSVVFCSFVLCRLHWYSPGVRGVGEIKITIEFVASRVNIRVGTMSYVGSWTTPKTATCGCF